VSVPLNYEVVLVAYNEADTIETEVDLWHEYVLSQQPGGALIVAEDGSTDGTSEILQRLQGLGKLVHDHSTSRRGYRGALISAMRHTSAPHVVFADTGFKQDVRNFWAIWPYRYEAALVVGRKVLRKDPLYRRVLTLGYNAVLRGYFGVRGLHDADSGFRVYSRQAIDTAFGHDLVFRELVGSEVSLRVISAGLPYLEIPIAYQGREGESRGLPLAKIPEKVLGVLLAFPKLRTELRP